MLIKRPAYQNTRIAISFMSFRARKVFGTEPQAQVAGSMVISNPALNIMETHQRFSTNLLHEIEVTMV